MEAISTRVLDGQEQVTIIQSTDNSIQQSTGRLARNRPLHSVLCQSTLKILLIFCRRLLRIKPRMFHPPPQWLTRSFDRQKTHNRVHITCQLYSKIARITRTTSVKLRSHQHVAIALKPTSTEVARKITIFTDDDPSATHQTRGFNPVPKTVAQAVGRVLVMRQVLGTPDYRLVRICQT